MVICISNKDVIITDDDTLRGRKHGFLEAAIFVTSFWATNYMLENKYGILRVFLLVAYRPLTLL